MIIALIYILFQNGENTISLKEYLLGVLLITKAASKQEMFHLAFQVHSIHNNTVMPCFVP